METNTGRPSVRTVAEFPDDDGPEILEQYIRGNPRARIRSISATWRWDGEAWVLDGARYWGPRLKADGSPYAERGAERHPTAETRAEVDRIVAELRPSWLRVVEVES